MKKYALFSIVFLIMYLFFPVTLYAQRTVKGKIIDTEKNEVVGANVSIIGTTNGTVSDANGLFSIVVPNNSSVLRVSYVGYKTQDVKVESREEISIILEPEKFMLDELVVIGYGTQKSSRVTNSVSKLKGEDLTLRATGTADEALLGKVAGVRVMQMDGMPGHGMDIKVRGISSINYSNAPLYVVDGFPVDNLNSINVGDIESLDVLKDAASTAIYGSRGSQGVILITTKKGGKGKPAVQLNVNMTIQKPWSKIKVLNRDEWIDFAIEERNNTYELNGGKRTDDNSKRKSAYQIDPIWFTDPTSLPDNDWYDICTRNALMQNYQLSVSGATDNSQYYFSANWMDQPGDVKYTDYDRLSFTGNVDRKVNKFLKIGINLNASQYKQNNPSTSSYAAGISRIALTPPVVGINQNTEEGGYYAYCGSFIVNPLAQLRDEKNFTRTRKIRNNIYAEINFLPELKLKSSFGSFWTNASVEEYYKNNINRGKGSTAYAVSSEHTNYLTEHVLSYDKTFNDFALSAIAGFSYQEDLYYYIRAAQSGFADDDVQTLNAGTTMTEATSSKSKWTLMSFFSRLNMSYKDRYLAYFSIRRDGSSRFGKDNRWGYFPAGSVGWRVTEENFMKDVKWLSNLKLKASYGVAGNNNISDYASLSTLASNDYIWKDQVVSGYAIGGYENTELGWEKTFTWDYGIELGFLKNRIQLNIDYFNAHTKDLLLSLNIPQVTGFSSTVKNLGEVENKGVEFELNTTNISTRDFTWSTSANISNYKNKVLKLGDDDSPIYGYADGYMVTITEVGKPIGSYYMLGSEGVFKNQEDFDNNPHYKTQNVGDTKFEDHNHDGVINDEDKYIQGDAYPDFTYGMTNTFAYKNISLSISIDGQQGGKILRSFGRQDGQSRGNVWAFWKDRWKSEEDPGNGWVPRAVVSANMTTPSSFWLFDQSFFCLRNIALGYTLPKSIVSKLNFISDIRFKASIDNIYMHDHYNHAPTTANQSNTAIVPNNDSATTYPIPQNYTLGVTCSF